MSRKEYDPLAMIPSPAAIRQRLAETERLAGKLKILLDVAERLHLPVTTCDKLPAVTSREAARG